MLIDLMIILQLFDKLQKGSAVLSRKSFHDIMKQVKRLTNSIDDLCML